MNILEPIIQEIQDKTGLTITGPTHTASNEGIPYYTTYNPNTNQTIQLGLIRHIFFIIKTTDEKYIDLNHPQSIEKIIRIIKRWVRVNPYIQEIERIRKNETHPFRASG